MQTYSQVVKRAQERARRNERKEIAASWLLAVLLELVMLVSISMMKG